MQYQDCHICSTRRRLHSVRKNCTVSEGPHLQYEDRVCGVKRSSALSGKLQQRYEEKKCAVLGGSHLQYIEKVVQHEERVYKKGYTCSLRTG